MSSLPPVRRIVTTTSSSGKSRALFDGPAPSIELPSGLGSFTFVWTASGNTPVNNADETDHAVHDLTAFTSVGLSVAEKQGVRCIVVDTPPGAQGQMHKTSTFDVCIVHEGEVVMRLEEGDEKTIKKGDVVIQRGTMHAWKNGSTTEWARMYIVVANAL